jgi:DNA-binding MarR family transcriptional regulator
MSSIMRQSVDHVNHKVEAGSDDVLEAVHAVMHLFRSRQHRAPRGGDASDVTHMDSKVLGFFARNPGATQSDLAAHSGRDKGQLARLVAGLRERGLLQARADEADRRNVRLSLTARGQAVQQALQRRGRRLSGVAVAGLSAEERVQLVALLQRVRANLEADS